MPLNDRLALCLAAIAAALLLVAPGCGVPSADGPADTYGIDFRLPPDAQVKGAIVFMIDGVNYEVFEDMLAKGELPAIRKYFIDRGTYCPRAVANVPSVTLANLTTMVTGRLPGHHDITGINWFDRNTLIWRNYSTISQKNRLDRDYTAPTIYEQLPDQTTYSVFFQPHRGSTKFFENWTSAGPPFYFGWYEFVDRLTLYRLNDVADIARQQRRFPAVTYVYLLATDFRAYQNGPNSPLYHDALAHADRQIGRVLGDLDRAGLLDKLTIAMVSDHGHFAVQRHFDCRTAVLEGYGLKLAQQRLWENTPYENRLTDMESFNAVCTGSGDRYWTLTLRKPIRKDGKATGWEPWVAAPSPADLRSYPGRLGGEPTDVDLPAELVKIEAVDVLAYACGPDRVRIVRKNGEVEFRQDGGREAQISYRVISGDDPLGYHGKVPEAALSDKPMPGRQWLAATLATDYPDLPEQILAYFRARRSGDVVMFAAPGWDFSKSHFSGHGGIRPQDMCVPMVLAGPDIPHQIIDVARTADLMPTLLTLLGRAVPPGVDGRSLLPPLPPATQPASRPDCPPVR